MLPIYILILGFISGVTMETCPESKDIFPCACFQLKVVPTLPVECKNNSKTPMTLKLLENALKGLIGKINVSLQLYNIQETLPSNIFSGIGIKTLDLQSCRMDSLTKDDQPGLLGLENHLQKEISGSNKVFLSGSDQNDRYGGCILKGIPKVSAAISKNKIGIIVLLIQYSDLSPMKLHLGHLHKLESITFFLNNITEFLDDTLNDVPPTLKQLNFWYNNIGKIGSHAFSRLNRLKTLWLNNNRFVPVKRSMFPDGLEMLQLNNNSLTDMPIDLFRRMPSIVRVEIKNNRITTIDERTWSPIWQQLIYIDLEGNNIVCDDRLNWITKSKRRPNILGECSAPKKWEKTSLEKFFRSKSR